MGVPDWMRMTAAVLERDRDRLNRLDADIGDGDHGANMARGFAAVVARMDGAPEDHPATELRAVGMTLLSTVGGAAGPLYGSFFIGMATALREAGPEPELGAPEWAAALSAAVAGVQRRGRAEPGDKTMVDALVPAREALDAAAADGASLADGLRAAAEAAERGALETIPLVARKGRASYLGERSAGHLDPGAASSALLLRAAAEAWGETR
ncbi:dihydroxyacetone kinase subunit DhaL [Conexibacter arvalis]|uniref:Dihydroxyacetone kinase-like protein n=1 Tax=Conexibacter arvalis TaxID=912552 RepID=A0A840II96_9ACTN|nr:dihydroxyacetone kinase subunit DhaL [Conexibacter arvalis]MBB4664045.1 dihydroxyacetone kinase-like protein [Conexibacter arvalis]